MACSPVRPGRRTGPAEGAPPVLGGGAAAAVPPAAGITRGKHAAPPRIGVALIERLATDRHYFAKPARTLFYDIRTYFPMSTI